MLTRAGCPVILPCTTASACAHCNSIHCSPQYNHWVKDRAMQCRKASVFGLLLYSEYQSLITETNHGSSWPQPGAAYRGVTSSQLRSMSGTIKILKPITGVTQVSFGIPRIRHHAGGAMQSTSKLCLERQECPVEQLLRAEPLQQRSGYCACHVLCKPRAWSLPTAVPCQLFWP